MTQSQFIHLFQSFLWTTTVLSMPLLLISLVIGVLISIVQVVTQIQEATLTFVPKLIVSLLALLLLAPWMVDYTVTHTAQQFALMLEIARSPKQ
jgi:flagellar biosynthesis protein FliQ